MGKEADIAEKSALAALRENEARAAEEEMSIVLRDLERERTEAEAELKRHLQVRRRSFRVVRCVFFQDHVDEGT